MLVAFAAAGLARPAQALPSGLALTGSFQTRYDSNMLRSSGSSLAADEHRDDFRYSPAANASYERGSGRLALRLNGAVGRDIFQYHDYLDRNHYSGGGGLTYRAGPSCQAVVNGNVNIRQNSIRDAAALDDEVIIVDDDSTDDIGRVVDNVQTRTTYGANGRCRSPTGRLSFGVGYVHSALSNAAISRSYADSNSDAFSGDIGLGIVRPGQLSVTGSYSSINYPNRAQAAAAIGLPLQTLSPGVSSYHIGLAYSRPIGTRLEGSIGASFLHVNPTAGAAPYSAPAYNVSLHYRASNRLQFGINGARDAIASTTAVAAYRVVDRIALDGSYTLGRSITIDANAAFVHNAYRQSIAIPGEPARADQSNKTFGVGVQYTPRSLYDIRLDLSQTMRTSNPSILNYSSTRASISLAVHI